jgi:predicted RNase H-like nuclease (RuvC/YqgF family)
MSKPKNSKDALEFIHTLDSLAIKKQQEEINRLCAWGRGLESDLSHARVEISFLKAEVERLRASSFVTAVPVEEYEKLKAEVERLDTLCKQLSKQHSDISCENIMLRKAGDAVCESPYLWENDPAVIAWRAAKEGKPSV